MNVTKLVVMIVEKYSEKWNVDDSEDIWWKVEKKKKKGFFFCRKKK